jgi:hypothetical protein
MHTNSTSPYGIQLLDDLHNYFPAILYNPDRFSSVRSMIEYIQTCTRERFDIFTNNSNNYIRNNNQNFNQRPSVSARQTSRGPINQNSNIHQYTFPSETLYTFPVSDLNSSTRDAQLLTTILGLFASPGLSGDSSFLDPVSIYPTIAQIERASVVSREEVTDDDMNCSICRDNIIENEEIRRLNNCSHAFHKVCIDQWFRTNVHCPICRDDIRVPHRSSTQ